MADHNQTPPNNNEIAQKIAQNDQASQQERDAQEQVSVVQQSASSSGSQKLGVADVIALANANPKVSDIHISTDEYLAFRITGDIVKQEEYGRISSEFMELFLKYVMKSDTDRLAKFRSQKDLDFAFVSDQ